MTAHTSPATTSRPDRLTRARDAWKNLGTTPYDGVLSVQDQFTYGLVGVLAATVDDDEVWDAAIATATTHVTDSRRRRSAQADQDAAR